MDIASFPDIDALRTALAAAVVRADAAEAAQVKADASQAEALIVHLKLEIEKLRRDLYGQRSERKARLLEQFELQLEDLEATASEDEPAAEQAAAKTTTVKAFSRRKPSRKPSRKHFPAHLPRGAAPLGQTTPAGRPRACEGWAKPTTRGAAGTEGLPRMWLGKPVEARRGYHRDPGIDPPPVVR